MPTALSKSTRSLTTIRPASGRMRPARQSSVSVLPEPEGPNSPHTASADSHRTSRLKPGSCLVRVIDSTRSVPKPPEPPDTEEEQDHDRHRQQRGDVGLGHLIGLH